MRGVVWVADQLATEAERQLYDEERIRAEWLQLEIDAEDGKLSEEEFRSRDDELLERLAVSQAMRGSGGLDPNDLADPADARAEPRRTRDERQARLVEPAQAIERARRERVAIEVAHRAGEIADLAVAVQEAGLFLAGRAVAQKLHGGSPRG